MIWLTLFTYIIYVLYIAFSAYTRKALGLINEPQIQPGHKRGVGLYFGEITQVEKVEAALILGPIRRPRGRQGLN